MCNLCSPAFALTLNPLAWIGLLFAFPQMIVRQFGSLNRALEWPKREVMISSSA